MPLYKEVVTTPPEKQPVTPTIDTATRYPTQDNANIAISVEGTPWYVTYYAQLLGKDDAPRQIDLTLDPSLQQYARINNYVIMETDGLEPSTDGQTTIMTGSGSGTLYPGATPNVGDHFIATKGDGQTIICVVKTVTRNQLYKYSSWNITYEYFQPWTQIYQDNFDRKTVRVFYFDPTKAGTNCAMQTTPPLNNVGISLARLVNWFYDEFYDLTTRTALYPGRKYDGELVRFFTAMVDRDLRGMWPRLVEYETPSGEYEKRFKTLWDAFMEGEEYVLSRISKTFVLRSPMSFVSPFVYTSLMGAQISSVIYPAEEPTMYENGSATKDFYVLTEAFYKDDLVMMSPIERYVRMTLRQEKFTSQVLEAYVNDLPNRTPEERFYLIPLYIWMLLYSQK